MNKIVKKCIESKTVWIFYGIIFLIIISSLLFLVFGKVGNSDSGYANIYQNGELLYSIDLHQVEKNYTITVKNDDGGVNKIEIRNGSIGVIEANCPDEICVNMGFIENGKLPITCLPNHLVIEIGEKSNQAIDGISY